MLTLRERGVILPEEIELQKLSLGKDVNMTGSLVDSFTLPRSVFGRVEALAEPMSELAFYLEQALPLAMDSVSVASERIPQKCQYIYEGADLTDERLAREYWSPLIDWMHPWKLSRPGLLEFMREIKRNVTERPAEYADYQLRHPIHPMALACHG